MYTDPCLWKGRQDQTAESDNLLIQLRKITQMKHSVMHYQEMKVTWLWMEEEHRPKVC